MKILEKFNSVLKKLKREKEVPKPITSVPLWIKAVAIGRYQDEAEGAVVKAGWIRPPKGNIIFDGSRGAFLVLLDMAKMECGPLPTVWPDKDDVSIEYRSDPAGATGMWPVAKSVLILEDGRVFVWPEMFHFYREVIRDYIQQAAEFFEDEKWHSVEKECEKIEAGV